MIHSCNQILMKKFNLPVNHVDEEFPDPEKCNGEEDDGEYAANMRKHSSRHSIVW